MLIFGQGQPALLYLAPACTGTPLVLAVVRGDIQAMLKYSQYLFLLSRALLCCHIGSLL